MAFNGGAAGGDDCRVGSPLWGELNGLNVEYRCRYRRREDSDAGVES